MAKMASITKTQTVLTIRITTNDSQLVQLFGYGVLAPGQLLPCPKEDISDPLSKYLL